MFKFHQIFARLQQLVKSSWSDCIFAIGFR